MNFSVKILGSSSAVPTASRFLTAQLITIYDEPLLIDCGEGTQIQLRRFRTNFGRINKIFISHLHGDHYFGLFGLISSYSLNGRTTDLHIFSDQKLEHFFKSDCSPIDINSLGFKLIFHHLPDNHQVICEQKNYTVECFPLNHNVKTWGFVFKEKQRQPNIIKEKITEYQLTIDEIKSAKNGNDIVRKDQIIDNLEITKESFPPRSYAFCSDTAYDERIVDYIKNVDLLYHETTYLKEDSYNAEKYRHSTSVQAAKIAKLAEVKRLLIGHFSTRYANANKFLTEAQEIFQDTIIANDGMTIDIDKLHKFSIIYAKNS